MFIQYTRNGRREQHAAYRRTLLFIWVFASEGEDIIIEGEVAA